ncbi:MAG: hypothetical protein IKT08_07690 [Bacteroidales bacterium]|nr:hypothetical protein [Bacteroidales bacterium]
MKTNLENYEERFVDYMEGQLDDTEMREVEAFVAQHPELEEDFKLFCSAKLEPDNAIVFTKKESLMKPTAVVRPLFVRIVAAAACIALLIGIGVRFLKPHHELAQQPMLAGLTPIKALPLDVPQEAQGLRKSHVKAVSIPKHAPEHRETKPFETIESIESIETVEAVTPVELIAAVNPIAYQQLSWSNTPVDNDIETQMFVELGERVITMEPLDDMDPTIGSFMADQREVAVASIQDYLFGNVRQGARDLYKRTAKTVMDVYHTADCFINETKDQLIASR